MTYSRALLEQIVLQRSSLTREREEITENLVNKLNEGSNISLAEEEYVCGFLLASRQEDGTRYSNVQNTEKCKNFWFKNRYVLYAYDLDGNKAIVDFYGTVDMDQKRKDTAFLEKEFQEWNSFIKSNYNEDNLLGHSVSEMKQQIKVLKRFCKRTSIGEFRTNYLIKSLVLNGKYIYLLVKEYYEELGKGENIIDLFGYKIKINSFSYIHILSRHYSYFLKEHQREKSYHIDQEINYKELPTFLNTIISTFKNKFTSQEFNGESIIFIFNGTNYMIWFKSISEPNQQAYLRVQTFYPIEKTIHMNRLRQLKEVFINSSLSFLI